MNLINKEIILKIIDSNPNKNISIKFIREEYSKLNGSAPFGITTLRIFMRNKLGFRYRKSQFKSSRREENRNTIMSHIFYKKMLDLLSRNAYLIYIDESSFNDNRSYYKSWYCPEKSSSKTDTGRFLSTTIIMAISEDGIELCHKSFKTNKHTEFISFLKELNQKINDKVNEMDMIEKRSIVYCFDNATIHIHPNVLKFIEDNNLEVVTGIPYTPEINPIEFVFGDMKKLHYKRVFKTK